MDTDAVNACRDIDSGPSKLFMMDHGNHASVASLFELRFGKRTAEEVYDLRTDPAEQCNLGRDTAMAQVKARLADHLDTQRAANEQN